MLAVRWKMIEPRGNISFLLVKRKNDKAEEEEANRRERGRE